MAVGNLLRRLRGALGNALVWGGAWFAAAGAVFVVLRVTGVLSATVPWESGLLIATKFGVIGAIAGGAFSSFIGLRYRGRRLSEIGWVRFGIGGAVVTGVFLPLFLQAMNWLSGDGLVAWGLVLDDALLGAVFGGAAAAGSLKLAQRGAALDAGARPERIEGSARSAENGAP